MLVSMMNQCGTAAKMEMWRRAPDDGTRAVRRVLVLLRLRQLLSLAVMVGVLLILAIVGIVA